jgi:hypothetical protein
MRFVFLVEIWLSFLIAQQANQVKYLWVLLKNTDRFVEPVI